MMLFLFSILTALTSTTLAGENCLAPGQPYMEEKFREVFHLKAGEDELREIVLDSRNYDLRQELKGYNSRLLFNPRRLEREAILAEYAPRFEKMIQVSGRGAEMVNFPRPGTSAVLLSTSEPNIQIEMKGFSTEKLTFVPPEIREKIGSSVKIKYLYPKEKFLSVITYKGEELPMEEAFYKIQDDFEESCGRRAVENFEIRQANNLDRKKRNYPEVDPSLGRGGKLSEGTATGQ